MFLWYNIVKGVSTLSRIAEKLGLEIGWLERAIIILLIAIIIMVAVILTNSFDETWQNDATQNNSITVTTNP